LKVLSLNQGVSMNRITIPIHGMSCGGCVRKVEHALGSLPGVKVEGVTVGSATVNYDPSVTNPGAIVTAIERAGYVPQAA
jgi:copper chaperone CopZ